MFTNVFVNNARPVSLICTFMTWGYICAARLERDQAASNSCDRRDFVQPDHDVKCHAYLVHAYFVTPSQLCLCCTQQLELHFSKSHSQQWICTVCIMINRQLTKNLKKKTPTCSRCLKSGWHNTQPRLHCLSCNNLSIRLSVAWVRLGRAYSVLSPPPPSNLPVAISMYFTARIPPLPPHLIHIFSE